MGYVIVGGYGTQAQAIGQYLLENTTEHIFIYDTGPVNGIGFQREMEHRVTTLEDLDFLSETTQHLVVISCLPTQFNAEIAVMAAQDGHSYIDLGGELHHTEEVIQELKGWEQHITEDQPASYVPDCGIAPGTVSAIVGHYIKQGAKFVEIFCGGIPRWPNLYEPHRYGVTFNPEGVIKEYTGVVTTVENGLLVCHPALDGLEEVFIHGLGYLEAVHMSGSLSKTPELLRCGGDQSFQYKTLRWPGHWQWVKENVLTQPNPGEIIEKVIPRIRDDYLVLMVRVDGEVELQKIWQYDKERDLTGMQVATGFSVGAVATMIADGLLAPGINWMHDVDFDELWKRILA